MKPYGLIYSITNKVNGKQYVGQTTKTIKTRWRKHKYWAEYGSVCPIHRAIHKYGVDAFMAEQIDTAESQSELNKKEVYHVAQRGTLSPGGYNLTIGGEGCPASTETRQKISIALTGRCPSQETRKKISVTNIGRKHTSEAKEKISKAGLGRKHTQSSRNKISLAASNRLLFSKEHCENISKALIGKHPSEKAKLAMSLSHKKTHCKRGHLFNEITTYIHPGTGGRSCHVCIFLVSKLKLPEKFKPYITRNDILEFNLGDF